MAKKQGKQSLLTWDSTVATSEHGHQLYYGIDNENVLYPDGSIHSMSEPNWKQQAARDFVENARHKENFYMENLSKNVIHPMFNTSEWDAVMFKDLSDKQSAGNESYFAVTDRIAVPFTDIKQAMDAIHERPYITEDYNVEQSFMKYAADQIAEQMGESTTKGFLLPEDKDEVAAFNQTIIDRSHFHVITKDGTIGPSITEATKGMSNEEKNRAAYLLFTDTKEADSLIEF